MEPNQLVACAINPARRQNSTPHYAASCQASGWKLILATEVIAELANTGREKLFHGVILGEIKENELTTTGNNWTNCDVSNDFVRVLLSKKIKIYIWLYCLGLRQEFNAGLLNDVNS